ncbi:Uncharacterised protein [Shigella sonnei]|nr:Uncharacterised protein [Shigella sonnei]
MPMALLRVPKLSCGDKPNCCLAIDSCWAETRVNFPLLASAFRSVSVASAAFSEPLVRLLTLSTSRTLPAVTPSAPSILLTIGCIAPFQS